MVAKLYCWLPHSHACCGRRFVCSADPGLGAAHVSGRSGAFVFSVCAVCSVARIFHFCLRRCRSMRSSDRRYASPSSPSVPRSGLKMPTRFWKGCLHCLRECVSLWQLRQCSWVSLRAATRAEDESCPSQRGGSSVWMGTCRQREIRRSGVSSRGQQLEDVSSHGSRQSGMDLLTFITSRLLRNPVYPEGDWEGVRPWPQLFSGGPGPRRGG